MSRDDRVSRAAFALGAALFLISLPWPETHPSRCATPREAEGERGRTQEVRCDGEGPALRGPARLLFDLALDPNAATAESLEVLPGIGPSRAAAIVAERERQPFRDVADLRRVRGIGPVTLARIAPWLAIGAEPATSPPPARLQRNR